MYMRKIHISVSICMVCIGVFVAGVAAETVDRIVAVVNDEPITKSELDAMLIPIYEQYKNVYAGDEFNEKITEARSNLLNQLIEDRLMAQEAVRLGIEVSEEEVGQQMEDIKSQFPSEEEFNHFLMRQNVSFEKLRKRYEEQIAIRKLHQYEVRQKVVVSPKEIEKYYNEHLADFTEKQKIKVRTIMIKKNPETENDQAKQTMEEIVKKYTEGTPFAELAKQYSEGTNANEGGQLGFIGRGDMIPEFEEVLFGLSVGERSPILETDIAYHLFLVEARQEKKVKPLAEVKDEIHAILFRVKSKERFEKWMQELKEDAYISIK